MPEKIITLQIPHQLEPVVNIWESPEDLLNFLQKKHPEVSWRRVSLSELVDEYGETCLLDYYPESERFLRDGITDLVQRGIRDWVELVPAEECDEEGYDEFGWFVMNHFSDMHWAWVGPVSDAKKIQLPRHQQIKARIALDEAIEEALS